MGRSTTGPADDDVVGQRANPRQRSRRRSVVIVVVTALITVLAALAVAGTAGLPQIVVAGAVAAPAGPMAVDGPILPDGATSGPPSGEHWSRPPVDDSRPAAPNGCRHPWRRPVDAAVTDPYRPPDRRYGPGNRGIEYGTEVGDPVIAVDAGVVVFAGPVAGAPVVVVDHGGGLRSSYVRLVEAEVARGEVVTARQLLARSDQRFHLGARRDGDYLDPADLLERTCAVVRLVPIRP